MANNSKICSLCGSKSTHTTSLQLSGISIDVCSNCIGMCTEISEAYSKANEVPEVKTENEEYIYGGLQPQTTEAVKTLAKQVEAGELKAEDIDLKNIDDNLFTAGLPDPDLIIRPSGEYRLSNFLIWQAAYSEFWFSDILWPDFTEDDLDKAIIDYCKRNRRFGGV